MDFVERPKDLKFPSVRWLKWSICKYPSVYVVFSPVPFIIYSFTMNIIERTRALNEGTYVPGVLMNRYAVCRPDDYLAQTTPTRYHN